jgi:hypothetical protein
MSTVDANLRTEVPQSIAERYGIKPGVLLDWVPIGEIIQVVPLHNSASELPLEARLRSFDEATQRQVHRNAMRPELKPNLGDRGWSRDELYSRGQPH